MSASKTFNFPALAPGRFVVFSESRLVLDDLETPTLLPITVGSDMAAELIRSDDPRIATVDSTGHVVGHRPGQTTLRTNTSASRLLVEVCQIWRTSKSKEADARRLGASGFAITRDEKTFERLAGRFDLIIDTISAPHDYNLSIVTSAPIDGASFTAM